MIRERSVLQKLMLLKMATGGGGLTEHEVTGNPAAFNTNVEKQMKQLLIPFTPVQEGSGDPSPDNIRPITGWTGVNVYHTRKNLLNPATMEYCAIMADGKLDTASTNFSHSGLIKVNADSMYTYSFDYNRVGNRRIHAYDENGNWIRQITYYNYQTTVDGSRKQISFSTQQGDSFIKISTATLDTHLMVELGDTASSYEEYSGATIPVTFPSETGTVYGGTLDLGKNKLTVGTGYIASYNGETLPGKWISDRDVYSSGSSPTIGAEVAYELDEPLEYNLSDINVPVTLIGDNVIFTSTNGQNTVKYLKRG